MDSLPSSFTIEVNGAPIAKVGDDAAHGVQAKTGPDAAVFTLKDSRLQCGDWVLGRSVKEDRSFLPKQVMWFKSAEVGKRGVQPVTASESGDSFLLRFASKCSIRGVVWCVVRVLTFGCRREIDCGGR
jgi:hypothetical protein